MCAVNNVPLCCCNFPLYVFYSKTILERFTTLTEKQSRKSPFNNEFGGLDMQLYWKRIPLQSFSSEFWEMFQSSFLKNTSD